MSYNQRGFKSDMFPSSIQRILRRDVSQVPHEACSNFIERIDGVGSSAQEMQPATSMVNSKGALVI